RTRSKGPGLGSMPADQITQRSATRLPAGVSPGPGAGAPPPPPAPSPGPAPPSAGAWLPWTGSDPPDPPPEPPASAVSPGPPGPSDDAGAGAGRVTGRPASQSQKLQPDRTSETAVTRAAARNRRCLLRHRVPSDHHQVRRG